MKNFSFTDITFDVAGAIFLAALGIGLGVSWARQDPVVNSCTEFAEDLPSEKQIEAMKVCLESRTRKSQEHEN